MAERIMYLTRGVRSIREALKRKNAMKEDRKLQGMKGERTAPRTPVSPAPSSKGGARQPQGAGNFNVERTPYGKKVK